MKKFLTVFLCMLMSISMATAKTPKKKQVVTKTYVTDIRCENCVNKIMKNIEKLGKGVQNVNVNLEKKEVDVTYDASKTNDANIIKGFSTIKVNAYLKGQCVKLVKCEKDVAKKCGDCKKKAGKCEEEAEHCDKAEAQKTGHCDKQAGACDKKAGHCDKAEAKKCDGKGGNSECKDKAGHCDKQTGNCDKKTGHCDKKAGECDKKAGHCKKAAAKQ